ncbi:MAG: polysaccharide lyase family 1 protein, partial [Steroidobacter sp.]
AFATGVTGCGEAAAGQIFVVGNRSELIAALNNGVPSSTSPANPSNEPKLIYIKDDIDANVDDEGQPLSCTDYYRDGYTLEAFLATYDPAVWGRVAPTGPLEAARVASAAAQQARVRIRIGSNTTIVGVGDQVTIRGAWFDIRGTAGVANSRTNIIIRNLTFQDTYDCFPQWAPTDGSLGSWNANYDSISLRDSNNVWIDHNTFEDVTTADSTQPRHFGVLYQIHDGALDITNASDLVTVSWNRFQNHDKVMLIGSSDGATADRGKLRVTLHHNYFERVGQRAPRVRFGQVHLYNNYYDVRNTPNYQYSWGVGIESAIYAESNFVIAPSGFTADRILARFNGTALSASDTLLADPSGTSSVDPIAAWNAVNNPDLGADAGWIPMLNYQRSPAWTTPLTVPQYAGPMIW